MYVYQPARTSARELTEVKLRWNMPLTIHWKLPLENTT